jgi:hypothetical protein
VLFSLALVLFLRLGNTSCHRNLLNDSPLLDLTLTKYEIISGDFSYSKSSASFHNFESDVVSNFKPGKTNTE